MPTNDELLAQIEALKAENEALRQCKPIKVMKTSKGIMRVYVPGSRFPVGLKPDQWKWLVDNVDGIRSLLK